jgi:hypothetical protein
MTDKLSPIHPGEVLLEEFIKPMNLSQNRLAIDIGVDARRINEIVLGKAQCHYGYRPAAVAFLRQFPPALAGIADPV